MSTERNPSERQEGSRKSRRRNGSHRASHSKASASKVSRRRGRDKALGDSRALPASTTGSLSATNPNRRVSTGNTGSLSATNPNRRVSTGNTGSLSAARPDRVQATGSVGHKSASGKKRGRYTPTHAAPKKRGMPAWGVILIVLFVAGIGVGGFFLVKNLLHPYEGAQVEDGQTVTVVIPEGSSGADITNILLDAGVIHSTKDFRKATNDQQADQSFKPGTYTFVTGADPNEVVSQLVGGPNSSEGQLQIPEGLTITQTAQIVENSLGIPKDDFIAQAKASNYASEYPFLSVAGNDSLEGFLYPKTYDFSGKKATPDDVIRLMLDQYQQEVQGLDLASAERVLSDRYKLNVTDYDILKIASIIEKEAINEEDRPKVSSVFFNRLSAGQALESDATMGYVTGGNVTADDLKQDSAYNTYLHKGLPPTPICSPSLWAIQAALEPADTPYYFFFIIEDGVYSNHTFSEDYETHHEAYTKALQEQREANGTAGASSADAETAQAEGGE